MIIPDLFIAGFEKCGTTSLHNILASHEMICRGSEKEISFFESPHYVPSKEHYQKIYFETEFGEYKYKINSRPNNAIIPYVADRIKQIGEDPRFIFLVREPIARSYSGWNNWHRMRPGRDFSSYEESIRENMKTYSPFFDRFRTEAEWMSCGVDGKYGSYSLSHIENGEYYRHIKRFIDKFGERRVFVMSMGEINHSDAIWSLFKWLDLPWPSSDEWDEYVKTHDNKSENQMTTSDIKNIYPDIYDKLFRIYYHDTTMLSKLTSINFYERWYNACW